MTPEIETEQTATHESETTATGLLAQIVKAQTLASEGELAAYWAACALGDAITFEPDARLIRADAVAMLIQRTEGRKTRSAKRHPPTPPSRKLPWPGPDGEPDAEKAAPDIAAALIAADRAERTAFWASLRNYVNRPDDDILRRQFWRGAAILVSKNVPAKHTPPTPMPNGDPV